MRGKRIRGLVYVSVATALVLQPVVVSAAAPTRPPTAPKDQSRTFYAAAYRPLVKSSFEWMNRYEPDLTVDGVEITQAIQCFDTSQGLANCADNSLSLVLDKPTAARIYIGYDNGLLKAATLANVPVRLTILAYGNTYTINTSGTGRATLSQANTSDSANGFFTAYGGNTTIDFYARVDPNNVIPESNEGNNRYPNDGYISIPFSNRRTMTVTGRPLDYHPDGVTRVQASGWAVNGGAAQWYEQLMPIRANGISYQNGGLLDWTTSLSGDGDHTLIRYLNGQWVLQVVLSLFGGAPAPRHVYAWTPNSAYGGGHADMPVYPHAGGGGVVAIGSDTPGTGTDSPGKGALIFGHEVTHDYDVKHTNTADSCGSSDSSTTWPYSTSSIQEYGFNPVTGKVYDPSTTHDIMSYCPSGGSKQGWISPFTWTTMYGKLAPASSPNPSQRRLAPGATATSAGKTLVVNLSVRSDGSGHFRTIERIPDGVYYDPVQDRGGRYAVVQRSSAGVLDSERFRVDFENEYNRPDYRQVDLAMAIPWMPGTTKLVLTHDGKPIDRRVVSADSPHVRITSPKGGEHWKRGTIQRVSWKGSDPNGGPLTYTLQYSRDGGNTWEMLRTEIHKQFLDIPVSKFPGGRLLFQVIVTDGVRIGMAHTTEAVIVPGHTPRAIILNPRKNRRLPMRTLLVLEGQAIDLETGNLSEARLDWFLDGVHLGEGTALPLESVPHGRHDIRLRATDPGGHTSSAHARVYVGHVGKPVFAPSSPHVGGGVTARAPFSDPFPRGGPYTCSINWGDGHTKAGKTRDGSCVGRHVYNNARRYFVDVSVLGGSAQIGTSFASVQVTKGP